jgi:hypothetical protein
MDFGYNRLQIQDIATIPRGRATRHRGRGIAGFVILPPPAARFPGILQSLQTFWKPIESFDWTLQLAVFTFLVGIAQNAKAPGVWPPDDRLEITRTPMV